MISTLWAGSQASYDAVALAEKKLEDGKRAGMYSGSPDNLPPLWEKRGSVGVVSIDGSLIDGDSGWLRLFGIVGYENIAQATIDAASDPDVKSLLFHVNSGGGAVNGCADTGRLISQVSALKPSATYTSNMMASAAYWLGSSVQGDIHTSQTAEVGSIGVLTVTREYTKQLEAEGVKVTVLRSGDKKALSNPYEPLSDIAKADIEAKLADVHDIFKAAVAKNRPDMSAVDLKAATDGSTFLGKRAVTAGLADKVSTFEQALKLLDKAATKQDNSSKSTKGSTMKVVLTAEQIAAISAGATLASLGIEEHVPTPEEAAAKLAAKLEADAKLAADAKLEADAADAAAKLVADAGKPGDVVALLQSQLVTANAEAMSAKVALETLKVTTQSQTAAHDGLLKIAREAIGKMSVALGGSAAAADTLDAAAAIAEHARIGETFKEKFKVGGVAASAAPAEKSAAADPLFLAAVKRAPTSK